MKERIAIVIYARALLEVAVESNRVTNIEEELKWVDFVLKKNAELLLFFKNPLIAPKDKKELVDKILAPGISLKLKNFLYLLIDKRRVEILEGLFDEYQKKADEYRGVIKAKVLSAIDLSSINLAAMKKALESKTKKTVKIETEIYPEIVGGLIVYIGSSIIDRSITGRLKVMREKLLAMEGL